MRFPPNEKSLFAMQRHLLILQIGLYAMAILFMTGAMDKLALVGTGVTLERSDAEMAAVAFTVSRSISKTYGNKPRRDAALTKR